MIVDEMPELLQRNRIYLDELTNDRLWCMDDPKVMEFFRKLIGYALVREWYRKRGRIDLLEIVIELA